MPSPPQPPTSALAVLDLSSTLAEIRRRIQQAAKRPLNEQNTKATLIEPVLRALRWDLEDVDEVQREFKQQKQDKPVDYGLLLVRTPRLFIEAKALGENLDDRRWAEQIMTYSTVAGVEWIVLTDGNEYRIYNAHAPVEIASKLFRRVVIAEEHSTAHETLELLAKERMAENQIEVLWRAEFVDRQVGAALEDLFSLGNEKFLMNYMRQHTNKLSADEIRMSLARCQVSLDFPIPTVADLNDPGSPGPAGGKGAERKASDRSKSHVSVADLIGASLISPPAVIRREYKGTKLTGSIEADGQVRFGDELYASLSTAAGAARASVIGLRDNGKLPATNGWGFWQVQGPDGVLLSLDHVRDQFLAREDADAGA